MKGFFLLLFLLKFTGFSQMTCKEDYKLLDEIISSLPNENAPDKPYSIYDQQIAFKDQQVFFSKSSFQEYTYPVLTVDPEKAKVLLATLDFDYFANQNPDRTSWDFSKVKNYKITPLNKNPQNLLDGKTHYSVSKPLYSKDKKLAFVFFEYNCGHMDCTSYTVKAYKKEKGKWHYYAQFPVGG